MRSDIFLHFLNRDTREIFGVYDAVREDWHLRLMRRALNAAVSICEDRCIAPPGFIVEDQIAFDLAESQRAFLSAGIIQLPMRENNLADFAEKKRVGYEPMRNRYSGLFSDTRIGFLGEHATGLINRRSHITDGILKGWRAGPDTSSKLWKPVKGLLTPEHVDFVAKVPETLDERGTALTWAAISPELPAEAKAASSPLRDALQHIYFQQYCLEFKLIVITKIPHIIHDFRLPNDFLVYNYRRFSAFLDVFGLKDVVLDAPADLLVELRRGKGGFISFIDAYAELARQAVTETTLKFHAGRARAATRFNWNTVAERRTRLFELSPVEVWELDDALGEAAGILVRENGLRTRRCDKATSDKHQRKALRMRKQEPELLLFVALEEELDVLASHLKLTKNPGTPEASGSIGGVEVDVICPRTMGRVAAAIATTEYLRARREPPKLIMIVGIAGGFKESGSVEGHIVCATRAVDLAIRKVVDQREGGAVPNFRREDYRMSDSLSRVLQSNSFDEKQWSFEACDLGWPKDRRPSIHYGPLASADEVVASDEWRGLVLEGTGGDSKLLGTEMEAGGVCAAAERARIPFCMLRVISDQADPAKTDNSWRRVGMTSLAHLISQVSIAEVLGLVR